MAGYQPFGRMQWANGLDLMDAIATREISRMLRNVRVYRLEPQWLTDAEGLAAQLASRRFAPCGSQEASRAGWAEVGNEGSLVMACGEYLYCKLRTETRKVPGDALRRAVDERAAQIEQTQGFRPGRKQRAEIREMVLMEMLPKAFPKDHDTEVIFDTMGRWLLVGTSSDAVSDTVLENLRHCIPGLPVRVVATVNPLAGVMREWLLGEQASGGFEMGDTLHLKGQGSVRYAGQELPFDEVRKHLEAGMVPVNLEINMGEEVSFRLMAIDDMRALSFLEKTSEEEQQAISGDQVEDFKASLVIRAGVVRRVLEALLEVCGGEVAGSCGDPSPAAELKAA
jgi:recombination associated protein RdgC